MAGKDTASNAAKAVTFNAALAKKVAQAQLKRRGLKRELTTSRRSSPRSRSTWPSRAA